jgi:oxygen-dependent protoporphyrinogen oxidase
MSERAPRRIDVDVVVVGGGISGLVAAHGLKRRGATGEVLEAGVRAGGVIGTQRRDGVLIERGPNSTLDTTPLINELLDALAIRGEREEAAAVAATRFIVRAGVLVPLPTSPGGFLTTRAFSLGARLRLLREPFIAPAPADAEESIAAFVRRRLGNELLDYAMIRSCRGLRGDPNRSRCGRLPAPARAGAEIRQPDQGPDQGARARRSASAKTVAASFPSATACRRH